MNRRVVITGCGAVSPAGVGCQALWECLVEGRSTASEIDALRDGGCPVTRGCMLQDFKPRKLIKQRKAIKLMCRDIQLAVVASQEAFDMARLSETGVNPERVGVILGSALIPTELDEFERAVRESRDDSGTFSMEAFGREGIPSFFPLWMLKYLPNMLACQVSIALDIQGISNTVTTGGTSSHQSIGEAIRIIERGDADAVLAGAGDARVHPMTLSKLALWNELAPQDHGTPAEAIRPFDANHAGYLPSEGAGIVVVEELEHARRRGATILAEVGGFGAAATASDIHSYNHVDRALAQAGLAALDDADMAPASVSAVSAAGLAVPEADAHEARALHELFGRPAQVPVTALKSLLGHAGAASGAVETVAAVHMLQHGRVPATLNFERPAEGCELNVVTDSLEQPLDSVLTHAFTLGGQASSLVLKKFTD